MPGITFRTRYLAVSPQPRKFWNINKNKLKYNYMKRLLITTFIFGSILVAGSVNAQMMGGFSNTTVDWNEFVEPTAGEDKKGKDLWNQLQAEKVVGEEL